MRARRVAPLVLALLFLSGCDSPPSPGSTTPTSSARDPSAASQASSAAAVGTMDVGPGVIEASHEYTGGAQLGDRVPLIVAVHGLGDRPEAFARLFNGFPAKAHFVFPAGGLRWGDGFAWWPITGTIDEQSITDGLSAAAKRLSQGFQVWHDSRVAGRPIITGFSQGGMLSFAMAARYPQSVGEAVPVAGLLPLAMVPSEWAAGDPKPRIFALHGDADRRVPHAIARKTVEALRALGLEAELESYPGVEHTISADMRRDLFKALAAAVERAANAP